MARQKGTGRFAGVPIRLHNGVVVKSSSDQLHVAMRTNPSKVRRLALKSVYQKKSC